MSTLQEVTETLKNFINARGAQYAALIEQQVSEHDRAGDCFHQQIRKLPSPWNVGVTRAPETNACHELVREEIVWFNISQTIARDLFKTAVFAAIVSTLLKLFYGDDYVVIVQGSDAQATTFQHAGEDDVMFQHRLMLEKAAA